MILKHKKLSNFPFIQEVKDPSMKGILSDLYRMLREAFANIYDDLNNAFTSRDTSLPTASVDYIGKFYLVEQGSAADKLYVCAYNTSSTSYEWKEINYA